MTLQGRVVDPAGAPVPVAEVSIVEIDDPASVLARSFTDADGMFRVPRVPLRGAWGVSARARDHGAGRANAISPEQPIHVRLRPPMALGGTLLRSDGSPAAGVVVRGIAFALRPPVEEFATTDRAGRWQLRHLTPGICSLVAAVPGEGHYCHNGWLLQGDDDVQLKRPSDQATSLTVKLRGMPAAAAGKVFVELAPDNGHPGMPPPWHHVPLDADGQATLRELPVVSYTVRLRSRELLIAEREQVLPASRDPQTVTFNVLDEQRVMREVVVTLHDPAGAPLPGVRLRLDKDQEQGGIPRFAVTDDEGVAHVCCQLVVGEACRLSSAQPDVVVHGIPAAAPEDGYQWQCRVFSAARDCALQVTASRCFRVDGRLLDADGEAAPGRLVSLGTRRRDGSLWAVTTAVSGPDGGFELPSRVARGASMVVTAGPDGVCCSKSFTLDGVPRRMPIGDLRLPRTGDLVVELVTGDGQPAAGVPVELRRMTAAGRAWSSDERAVTGNDGIVRFRDVMPGDFRVVFKPGGERGAEFERPCTLRSGEAARVHAEVAR